MLDDGWFGRRRDDTRGLGDWVVSREVWPDGLTPLVERVHALGMEFGLWVEPEMVNLDSELAEPHPEWLLQTARGPGIPSRYQHVLDLTHPDAYAHVRGPDQRPGRPSTASPTSSGTTTAPSSTPGTGRAAGPDVHRAGAGGARA